MTRIDGAQNRGALFAAFFCIAIVSIAVCLVDTQHAYATEETQPMYRLYNPNSGEHFYTSDDEEKKTLVDIGWNFESIGWIAPKSSNTPVYRLYNPIAGEHHYTPDSAERDTLVNVGWNDEGEGWHSDDAKTVPVYRDYNPNAFANNHNYTMDVSEHQDLVSLGWQDEGIGWYGVANDSARAA